MAKQAVKAMKSKRYKYVYCNVDLKIDGIIRIYMSDLGKFRITDGLVLIDEAIVEGIGNRDWKNIDKRLINFMLLHRHYNTDINVFSQRWDIDKTIKAITDRVFYIYKPFFTGWFRSKYYRIPFDIIIPDPKNGNGEKLGDIIQGYCKPSLMQRIFCGKCYRPLYYKYFDSWEAPVLPALPPSRVYRDLKLVEKTEEEALLAAANE